MWQDRVRRCSSGSVSPDIWSDAASFPIFRDLHQQKTLHHWLALYLLLYWNLHFHFLGSRGELLTCWLQDAVDLLQLLLHQNGLLLAAGCTILHEQQPLAHHPPTHLILQGQGEENVRRTHFQNDSIPLLLLLLSPLPMPALWPVQGYRNRSCKILSCPAESVEEKVCYPPFNIFIHLWRISDPLVTIRSVYLKINKKET